MYSEQQTVRAENETNRSLQVEVQISWRDHSVFRAPKILCS